MKQVTTKWLLPLALLTAQPALADFTTVFYDPCDGCTYFPDSPWNPGSGYSTGADSALYYGGDSGVGGDIVGAEQAYDVLSMTASVVGNSLAVNILTRFTLDAYNLGDSNIIFGDLMLAVGPENATWNPSGAAPYALDDASTSGTTWNYVVDTQTGSIYQGDNTMLMNTNDPGANAFYDGTAFRHDQYIQYDSGGVSSGTASVDIQPADLPDVIDGNSIQTGTSLTYTINLANLGLLNLTNPMDVALRWTMTCANDIVEGKITLAASAVPEPASWSLFAGGLGGLGWMRWRKRSVRETLSS